MWTSMKALGCLPTSTFFLLFLALPCGSLNCHMLLDECFLISVFATYSPSLLGHNPNYIVSQPYMIYALIL